MQLFHKIGSRIYRQLINSSVIREIADLVDLADAKEAKHLLLLIVLATSTTLAWIIHEK